MPFVGVLLANLARFLLSGIVARIAVSLVFNAAVFGGFIMFQKNLAEGSLDFALRFFNVVGLGGIIAQMQGYYSQLPQVIRDGWSYLGVGAMIGAIVNSYIGSIFLAWIMRKFG